MAAKVSLTQVDKNLNTMKKALPAKLHPSVEKTRKQVTTLDANLKDANAAIKTKDDQLKTQGTTINKVKTDISAVSKQVTALNQRITGLEKDVQVSEARNVKLTKDLQFRNAEVTKLKADLSKADSNYQRELNANKANKAQIAVLTSENKRLEELYEAIKAQKKRPIATPTQLSTSFKKAMESMRAELKTLEESPVDYIISKFDVEIKTGIGVDEKDNVNFRLPKDEEVTKPENLSTIQFSIRTIPKGQLKE